MSPELIAAAAQSSDGSGRASCTAWDRREASTCLATEEGVSVHATESGTHTCAFKTRAGGRPRMPARTTPDGVAAVVQDVLEGTGEGKALGEWERRRVKREQTASSGRDTGSGGREGEAPLGGRSAVGREC